MKIVTTLLLLLSISLSAQNQRFIYEYTFVKDSLEKDKTSSENMYLDITKKGSKYYSYDIYESDSLREAELEKQTRGNSMNMNIKITQKRKGQVSTVVEKKYPSFEIVQFNDFGGVNYKVSDDRKIVWKIEPETMKIGEFNTQKATTKMYGRNWIVWFSKDLPFQDGPNKFHGLPGLIVKIESLDRSHIIELKGVKTLPKDFEIISAKEKETFTKTVEMDISKYKKTFQNFLENPVSPLRTMSMGDGVKFTMKDKNGNPVDINKKMRENEEKMKEANKKINNLFIRIRSFSKIRSSSKTPDPEFFSGSFLF